MHAQTLDGQWLFRQRGSNEWLPAAVPGAVHTDLQAAGKIPDPFFGENELAVQWVAEKDWEYRRYFHPDADLLRQDQVWLVCDGLDTLAEVRLNEKILGAASNMFHAWRWEIKSLLNPGENRLDIAFRSPVAYIRKRQRAVPMPDTKMGISGAAHLRKAPYQFGWDWGPRLASIGIWRGVRLEGKADNNISGLRLEQQHENGIVNLTARISVERHDTPEMVHTLRVRVTGPDRQVWQVDAPARAQQNIPITIANPQLWWPNGMGDQPMYQVEVSLLQEDRARQETTRIDYRQNSIGLRTLSVAQEEDAHGKRFTFVVNGQPFFARGSNWIPADSFPARVTAQVLEERIRAAAQVHQNMLRVWGGGFYEDDQFYNLCDRYGLLVWQDFMFACSIYPLDEPAFLESVQQEVIETVRRLRHHVCLALWCGNNEVEMLGQMLGWVKRYPKQVTAYQQFFFETLPALLAQEDPDRPYWPGSPSDAQPFQKPNDFTIGDTHLWDVYHRYKLPSFYRTQSPRFVSEFGMQSLPALATIAAFTPPDQRQPGSRSMAIHQRAFAGNPKLSWYIAQRFRLGSTLEDLIYLSQVYQAEAVRAGVEHWRRHPEITSGALYWQLNDCWPVISWSSIDYYGRWKALHYAARRFFAPLLLSVEEDPQKHSAEVWLSNDTRAGWQGTLRWTLETVEGDILHGGEQTVQVEPFSAAMLLRQDFSSLKQTVDWRKTVFVVTLWQGDFRHSMQVIAFLPERAMQLPEPELKVESEAVDGYLNLRVSARRLARFVEVSLPGSEVVFRDNYFDLPAGQSVELSCPLPPEWTAEQAQAALRVRSLVDVARMSPAKTAWQARLALAQSALQTARFVLKKNS